MIRVSIQKRVTLTVPGFSADQMRQLAESAIAAESARWGRGLNLSDAPAKPLSESYQKRKALDKSRTVRRVVPTAARAANSPVRNLRFTGQMAESRQVTLGEQNRARIEFVGGQALLKANANQQREPQIGLSPMDRRVVAGVAQQLMAENIRGMKRSA